MLIIQGKLRRVHLLYQAKQANIFGYPYLHEFYILMSTLFFPFYLIFFFKMSTRKSCPSCYTTSSQVKIQSDAIAHVKEEDVYTRMEALGPIDLLRVSKNQDSR